MGWGSSPADDEYVRAALRRRAKEEEARRVHAEAERVKRYVDESAKEEVDKKDA